MFLLLFTAVGQSRILREPTYVWFSIKKRHLPKPQLLGTYIKVTARATYLACTTAYKYALIMRKSLRAIAQTSTRYYLTQRT